MSSQKVDIHNHYSEPGRAQREQVAEVIADCQRDGWSSEATTSAVFVALLNIEARES